MMWLGALLESGYLICQAAQTCCDSPGIGGICCTVCENCVSGACVTKSNNSVCGTGFVCCSGVCTPILSDPNNCGSCGNVCTAPNCVCNNGSCVEGACP